MTTPRLYGLNRTNRDFTHKDAWGKNNFNSAFPASLCCYLDFLGVEPIYLKVNVAGKSEISTIAVSKIFGLPPGGKDTYYAFEAQYSPYQKYVVNDLPRVDLVIQNLNENSSCVSALEIKLTALPDESTFHQKDGGFGSELVVRPDSIVYLACSIVSAIEKNWFVQSIPNLEIADWSDALEVSSKIQMILIFLNQLAEKLYSKQSPFLLQPIWKTEGKSPLLSENCLDVFVWSNAAFCRFIAVISNGESNNNKITRQTRSAIWLFKMLFDYSINEKFNHKEIIDTITFNTKNDKAFSANGKITHPFMSCTRLTNPVIKKNQIKEIILGGGQLLLSPERRFDAIVSNTPGLFE